MDPTDKKVEEVAKAAAAVAQFGTKAVGATEKILRFGARVFKQPIDETSGIIGDRLRLFRWERQVVYINKVNQILEAKGVKDTRAVPPKFALPVLENASLEDDDNLQTLWANLMANAMDPSYSDELRMVFIDIIKSLTPIDIQFLEKFYRSLEQDPKIDWDNISQHNADKEEIMRVLNISSEQYEVSAYNLFRNQCLAPAILTGGVQLGNEPITIYKGTKSVVLTDLGIKFIKACLD